MAVTSTTIKRATGTELSKLVMKSADREGRPPVRTRVPSGAGMARTFATRSRPAFESGTTLEKTWSRVVSSPMYDFR